MSCWLSFDVASSQTTQHTPDILLSRWPKLNTLSPHPSWLIPTPSCHPKTNRPPQPSAIDQLVTASTSGRNDSTASSPTSRQPQQQQQQQQQGASGAQFSLGAAARDRLKTQQRLQDELAEDMLGLTAEMKAGAVAMQNVIRYRCGGGGGRRRE